MKKTEESFYRLLHMFLFVYLTSTRQASQKTIKSYKDTLNQFRKYMEQFYGISFLSFDFSCFGRSYVYAFLEYLRDTRGLSVNTINLRLAAIKSFLRYCSDEDIELGSIYLAISKIHKFKGTKKPGIEYLKQDQLKLTFSIPDIHSRIGRRDRFMMIFLYETGIRIAEFTNLKINDIIRNEGLVELRIEGKGRKIRVNPISRDTVAHLDAYLKEFHPNSCPNDYLFYTIHNDEHTRMTPGTVDSRLKVYAALCTGKDSSFPANLHAHVFRHSVGMAMFKKGVPLSHIADFLGHSTVEVTRIYSHADGDTIAAAIESVDHEKDVVEPLKKWKGSEEELLAYCGLR